MTPQPQNFVSPATPGTPGPPPSPYGRQKKVTKAIEIKNPTTGATVKIDQKPTSSPTVASASTPVIVSSPSPTPGRAPSRPEAPHSRSTSRSSKTPEEKRQEMRDKVLLEAKKAAAEEDKKRREEAEKSEVDKKRQEEEAEAEKKRKEDEERAEAEAEEKAKREAEEAAQKEASRQEAARQEAARQEAARKEAARKEAARKEAARKEAEEIARKVAEEEELARKEAEEKAKLEAEEKARLEQEEKERGEAAEKAKAEAEEATKAAEAPAETDIEASSTPTDTPAPKPSPPDSESMPPPALKSIERSRSKPSPLNLQLKTNEPALPSAQLTALRSARPVENLKGLHYPEGIQSPNPALNPLATATRFKYDKDFLMQFQNVFTEKPYVDWDQRMRDTVGDTDSARPGTARTPSGMGSRSTSSRGSGMPPPLGGGAMGSFVGFAKSGSTSMERFQKSTANPLAGFVGSMSRPGGGLVRANSSTSLAGQSTALPQSPRTSNRSARGSKRGGAGGASMERSESKQASSQPTIPLAEVKPLPVSANRWTPRSVATTKAVAEPGASEPDDRMPPDMVQRKVKAALNKMTPEKFDKISDQILEITSQSKHENDGRTLRQVIQLTFEKACDEAHWASMYAKFCKRMLETMDPNIKDESIRDKHDQVVTGGNLFRKYLLNRCQEEFERGWKVNLPPKPEGESEEVAILSDEYYIAAAAKRRGLGLVQFIGELFKLGMLTERIMNECVRKLLDFEGLPEDETVESLTKLLRTIGAQLDSSEKSKPMMDLYFKRIDSMINSKDLNSRMRFMLMV
jgi:translation initiation factor 4G